MPCLLKFLSYEKDFTMVAEEILKECAASAHALSDSLEDSYKLLGNVLDCVPAGVAALEAFRNAYDFDICIL